MPNDLAKPITFDTEAAISQAAGRIQQAAGGARRRVEAASKDLLSAATSRVRQHPVAALAGGLAALAALAGVVAVAARSRRS